MHASIVLAEDVIDYAPLFVEIADAYFERALYAEARPIYELLGSDATVCICVFFCQYHTHLVLRQVVSISFSKQHRASAC